MKEFIQSPHAASATRESDVTASDWPVVTRSLLADLAKMESADPNTVNQGVLALIRARKTINDARIACQSAARFYPEERHAVLRDRLISISHSIGSEHDRFPLTLLENAKNHPRRHIMAGHDGVDRPAEWGVE